MMKRLNDQAFFKHTGSNSTGSGALRPPALQVARGVKQLHRRLLRWGVSLVSGLSVLVLVSPAQAQNAPTVPDANPVPEAEASIRPTLQIGSRGEAVRQLQAMLLLLGFYTGLVDGIYGASTAIAVVDFQEAAGLAPDGIMGRASWNQLLPSLASLAAEATTTEAAASEPTPAVPVVPAENTTSDSPSDAATNPSPPAFPSPTPTPANPPAPVVPPAEPPAEAPPAEATPPSPNVEAAPSDTVDSEADSEADSETEAVDPIDLPVLRVGMQGPAVERLQERLQALGFYNGAIDGIFGNGTKASVEAAQRNYGITADGVVGPATWAVLLR